MDIVGYVRSPIGRLKLVLNEERCLTHIYLNVSPLPHAQNPLSFEAVCVQLKEYFFGKRKTFTLPLCFGGSSFETCVWKALLDIPYGETRSYRDIAAVCGNPKAARAVGQAVHRNPIPIIIPCHRVIGTSGNLVGYAGGLAVKRFLLRLEGVCI